MFLVREMTKIHESYVIHPSSSTIPEIQSARGEFTIVLGPKLAEDQPLTSDADLISAFGRLTDLAGFSEDEASGILASAAGLPKRAVSKRLKKAMISVKQRRGQAP
jgi:16S rRNA C1402 (ribose-2'-O) methylase RsmI